MLWGGGSKIILNTHTHTRVPRSIGKDGSRQSDPSDLLESLSREHAEYKEESERQRAELEVEIEMLRGIAKSVPALNAGRYSIGMCACLCARMG